MTGKKRIFAGMGILLGVLVGVQGTAAYQSAYDKAGNIAVSYTHLTLPTTSRV